MTNVTITTAVKLSTGQLSTIRQAVNAKYPNSELKQVVNPEVIGGIKIQVDSILLDSTVKNKLNQLKLQLLNISDNQ